MLRWSDSYHTVKSGQTSTLQEHDQSLHELFLSEKSDLTLQLIFLAAFWWIRKKYGTHKRWSLLFIHKRWNLLFITMKIKWICPEHKFALISLSTINSCCNSTIPPTHSKCWKKEFSSIFYSLIFIFFPPCTLDFSWQGNKTTLKTWKNKQEKLKDTRQTHGRSRETTQIPESTSVLRIWL